MHNALMTVPVKELWTIRGVMGFLLVIIARRGWLLMKATGMSRQLKTTPLPVRKPNATWVYQRGVKTYVWEGHDLTSVGRCPARDEDGWSYMASQLA